MDLQSRFHLSIPVTNLAETARFYAGTLGQRIVRRTDSVVHLDFFGHHLVLHEQVGYTSVRFTDASDDVPHPHFGIIVNIDGWEKLRVQLDAEGVRPLFGPVTRYAGEQHEQRVLFITDPAENILEFKAFTDPEASVR